MITKWKLFNFKSIQKETELHLSPLTIFAGANSSGKSALIQSILLVAQTLSSKIDSRSVVLNGLFIKLGQFNDVRSFGSEADQVLIGWECEPSGGRRPQFGRARQMLADVKRVACEISFDMKTPSPTREFSQLHPSLFSCVLSSTVLAEEGGQSTSQLNIRRSGLPEVRSDTEDLPLERESIDFEVVLDDMSLEEIRERFTTAVPVGGTLSHFLPHTLFIKYNLTEEQAKQIVSVICERRLPYPRVRYKHEKSPIIPNGVLELLKSRLGGSGNFIDEISPIQPSLFPEVRDITVVDWIEAIRTLPVAQRRKILRDLDDDDLASEIYNIVQSSRQEQHVTVQLRFPRSVMNGVSYLNTFFSQGIRYLGPLRDEPRSLYPLVPNVDPTDVGLKGEYTAAVLNMYKGLRIRYIPSHITDSGFTPIKVSTRSLEAAVLDWLKYMEIAETIETYDRGKHGHEMKVTTTGTTTPQDLPHVGVGVSQVVPILVMCLLAEDDTTLIVEQPELHLHPLVQTRLADFFISMALLGKQCIIETHSEYLIGRLRSRIASSPDELINSISRIYFSEKDRNGHSFFREVAVNEFGAIPDWPKGFFDQSQLEAEQILRAAAHKRKFRRKVKSNDKPNH